MKLKHILILLLVGLLLASCSDSDDDNNEPKFENVVDQGTDGAGIKWALQEDGTLTIYGQGEIQNYKEEEVNGISTAPWAEYLNRDVKKIVISNSITSIGEFAFFGCFVLKEVIIPNSVTKIGQNAFERCESLTELVIPNSITEIEKGTFANCNSLVKLSIPQSVTKIGDGAFASCRSLTELAIPESVTSIGIWAFTDCGNVSKLTIPKSVTSIGEGAFAVLITFGDISPNLLTTIYSYCSMSAYPTEKLVFIRSYESEGATMYVSAADMQDYKAVQSTYWDKTRVTISNTPAP